MSAKSLLKSATVNLAKLAEMPGDAIHAAAKARLSEIDSALGRVLPYLGALRYFAKVRGVSLAELVETYGHATRSAFEDSKPYADILFYLGATTIPSAAFDSLPRAKARELAAALPRLKKDTATLEKVQGYLSGPCKFRDGWTDHLLTLIPAATVKTPPAPAPAPADDSAQPPGNVTPISDGPAPAESGPPPEGGATVIAFPETARPEKLSAIDLIGLVKGHLRAMDESQREAARSMLARLVNDPSRLAEHLAA